MKKLSILTGVLAIASFSFAQTATQEVKTEKEVKIENSSVQTVKPSAELKKEVSKKQFNTTNIQHKEAIKNKEQKESLMIPDNSKQNGRDDMKMQDGPDARD